MSNNHMNPFFDPSHPQNYYEGDPRAIENGRKGGLKGGARHREKAVQEKEKETRRQKKLARQEAERMLDLKYEDFIKELSENKCDSEEATVRQKMVSGAILESTENHDLKQTQYILQLVGEGPDNTQRVELTAQTENLKNFIAQLQDGDDLDLDKPDEE